MPKTSFDAANLTIEVDTGSGPYQVDLVLQRRDCGWHLAAVLRAPFHVRPLRSFIAPLRLFQPPQQFRGREAHPRQEFADDPVSLGAREVGHLFPPTPAASSARTHSPVNTW